MTTQDTKMLRDQILACLRDAYPMPLSTDQVAEKMPWITRTTTMSCWAHRDRTDLEVVECPGQRGLHVIRHVRSSTAVYRVLRQLENRELITRTPRDPNDKRRFWIAWPDPDVDKEIHDRPPKSVARTATGLGMRRNK